MRLWQSARTLLLLTCLACQRPVRETCELSAVTEPYSHVDNTLMFELPDSGGFIANGQPIAREELGRQLKAIFAPRRPNGRAVFVESFGPSRCADVAFLVARARQAGVAVFDRRKSGWPDPPTPPPDSLR